MMLRQEDSPLRLLVKSYANDILNREQYLKIRTEVLKKLASQSEISHEEVKNFISIYQDSGEIKANKSYSFSDWIIVVLGLAAAVALGLIIFG